MSDQQKNEAASMQNQDEQQPSTAKPDGKGNDGGAPASGDASQGAERDNESGQSVIRVARTPTSPAQMTRLRHRRYHNEAHGLGAGHTGSTMFHWQRLTAVALIPLAIWFVVGVVRMSTQPHAQAVEWLAEPVRAVLMALFIVIALRHAVIGLRIIFEDYVHDDSWRAVWVRGVHAVALVLGVASVAALIHLAL